MTGSYRRAIVLSARPGVVDGEIEDDFHHFAVSVRHDGERVTGVEGRAVRYPWSQCPMAATALGGLVGLPLTAHPTSIYRHVDPLDQCTHMLELAGLAVSHAARGTDARRYDVRVSDPVDGVVHADLDCDGTPLASWALRDGVIDDPPALRGQPAALRTRVLRDLPPDEAEAMLILRRAAVLAAARGMDVDRFPTAAAMGRGRACFVFSPGVAELAVRRRGSVRDFSAGPGPLPQSTLSGARS
jgi:hypothetical protein